MPGTVNVFVAALQQLAYQMAALLPKVVFAVLIWWIGVYLIKIGTQLLGKIDIKGTKVDDQIIAFLSRIAIPLGKFILVLIVLDYLGIGRTVISAFMNGLTLAIAIALGISFGRALEGDATNIVSEIRKHFKK